MNPPEPFDVDPREVSSARTNQLLKGGHDHNLPDRQAVARIKEIEPNLHLLAQQNVRFGHRVIRLLAEQGIRQFIDLGCGIPVAGTTHEVAWNIDPSARVVYVDNDPSVQAHVRALVPGDERTRYLLADARNLDGLYSAPEMGILDLDQPVGVLMFAFLHFLGAADDPAGMLDRIGERSALGSYVAASLVSHEAFDRQGRADVQRAFDDVDRGRVHVRTEVEIRALFGRRRLLKPGVLDIIDWRPDRAETSTRLKNIGGVAHLT